MALARALYRCSQRGRGCREGSPSASTGEGSSGEQLHPQPKTKQFWEQTYKRPEQTSLASGFWHEYTVLVCLTQLAKGTGSAAHGNTGIVRAQLNATGHSTPQNHRSVPSGTSPALAPVKPRSSPAAPCSGDHTEGTPPASCHPKATLSTTLPAALPCPRLLPQQRGRA